MSAGVENGLGRRTLLRGAAAAGLAASVAGTGGCGAAGRPIRVVVVWSGTELARFRTVVRGFERSHGLAVEVVSAGDGIDAFLRVRARTGNLPDVAVISRPGLIVQYADLGWLQPVPSTVPSRFPPAWNRLLTVSGQQYGAWVKAAHKSLFWYLDGSLPTPPQTWDGLVNLTAERAGHGRPAPLAIGAADGWVLTDWLENLLAGLLDVRKDHDEYNDLVDPNADWRAAPVRRALTMLGELWSIPGAFPDGAGRALLTQFGESVVDVVARHRATMVFEADFVTTVANDYPAAGRLRSFRFPEVAGRRPLLIGGDAAVVFRNSPAGAELVEWLSDGAAPFRVWIRRGGYLSPNTSIDVQEYRADLPRQFAAALQDPAERPRFDLSDQLPSAFGGADGIGMWRVLQDFLAAVATSGRNVDDAVDDAVERLAGLAERVRTGSTE